MRTAILRKDLHSLILISSVNSFDFSFAQILSLLNLMASMCLPAEISNLQWCKNRGLILIMPDIYIFVTGK